MFAKSALKAKEQVWMSAILIWKLNALGNQTFSVYVLLLAVKLNVSTFALAVCVLVKSSVLNCPQLKGQFSWWLKSDLGVLYGDYWCFSWREKQRKGEGTRRRLIGARNPISLQKVWKYSILVKVCVWMCFECLHDDVIWLVVHVMEIGWLEIE